MPFSLLFLEKNSTCDGMNFTHLTWLMLLHYLVKVETLKMNVNTNSAFNVSYKIGIICTKLHWHFHKIQLKIHQSQPKISYLILTFRSHHEIFIRRSWYSVLPSLDATISCRIKKAVVGVTPLITALVSIHSSMTFLADMYSFLDPPGRTVLFSVDDRSLSPVDCVIGLIRRLNVKIRYKFLVVIDEFLTVSLYQPNEFISRKKERRNHRMKI